MSDNHPSPNYYSIVLDAIKPQITPETLKPKVVLQTETGLQVFNSDGTPQVEYYNQEKHGNTKDNLIKQWATPPELYNAMDPATKSQHYQKVPKPIHSCHKPSQRRTGQGMKVPW